MDGMAVVYTLYNTVVYMNIVNMIEKGLQHNLNGILMLFS